MGRPSNIVRTCVRFVNRLARDTSGNAIMIIAASLLPLLAMVGGGLDIGRGYLVQARLQQACDAGVLAARKRLGTETVISGIVPTQTAEIGDRFFKTNFRNASYGSTSRDFAMTLEDDYSITGVAEARMPTTLMGIFGQEFIDVKADCSAQLNMSNTDIMMVLDMTGSMALTNPGDTDSRMDVLKTTVRSFYDQLSASESSTSRIRYGFLPYSSNVNVGGLLQDNWVVDDWDYQSRKEYSIGSEIKTKTYNRNWKYVSGTVTETTVHSTYPATWHAGGTGGTYVDENENVVNVPATGGYYTCDTAAPATTRTNVDTRISYTELPFVGPPAGTQTIDFRQRILNGMSFWNALVGDTCEVRKQGHNNYTQTYEKVTEPEASSFALYLYKQYNYDVSDWRTFGNGCMEERNTYIINDYDNVDLTQALDLDLDLIPSDDASRWRPMHPDVVYARRLKYDGTGSFNKSWSITKDEFVAPVVAGTVACPAAAKKLGTMTTGDLDTYLGTLYPSGATYHDIGMIWGGRLISPTGLFAAENADISAQKPTSRHMIFLTDGETETLDLAYSSYGLEPLDQRRWNPSSTLTLTQTVEKRFSVACDEVKKRGVTVWVIGFGTNLGDFMKDCAGDGHYFEAADAAELNATFADIAASLAALRITD